MTPAGKRTAESATATRKRGRPSKTAAEGLATHIVKAGLAEFTRNGFKGTSIDAIAAAARISKRTFYARFESKQALFTAIIDYLVNTHFRPATIEVPEGPVRDRLLHLLNNMLNASLHPEVTSWERLIMSGGEYSPDFHAAIYDTGYYKPALIIQSILDEAVRKKEISVEDSLFTATLLLDAMVSGPRRRIMLQLNFVNDPATKHNYIARSLEVILTGLYTKP